MFHLPPNTGSKDKTMGPNVQNALDNMKMEAAKELGINTKHGYHGELPNRVGGQMVKRMIAQQEKVMSNPGSKPIS